MNKDNRCDYVVVLPNEIRHSGNCGVSQMGITNASSARKAVTNLLSRAKDSSGRSIFPRDRLGLVISQIDKGARNSGFSGVEAYAYAIPEVRCADYKSLSCDDRMIFREMAVAQEIASARGDKENPGDYLAVACKVLKFYDGEKLKDIFERTKL